MPARRRSQRTTKPNRPRPWVASVAVVVSDIARSRRWYTESLGLDLLSDGEHWITVGQKRRGGQIHLCRSEGQALEPGNSGILLLVEGDLTARVDELRSRGVEIVHPPTERPWGWDATIRDPDGNEHLLMNR